MRGVRTVVAGVVLVGTLMPGTAWAASCGASTARARFAVADVVFDGVAQDRPARDPAAVPPGAVAFSVRQWHKPPQAGRPGTVTVRAATGRPRAGEVWRVYATASADGTLAAFPCSGTHALASLTEPPAFAGPGAGFTGLLATAAAGLGLHRRRRARWVSRPGRMLSPRWSPAA